MITFKRSPNNFKDEWLLSIQDNDRENININRKTEEALAKYIGVRHCALTCNGTAAIYLGMLCSGLKDGEIILPDFGYWSVKLCAEKFNLTPIFVDIKLDTLCMDPNKVEDAITDRTKAICFINHLGYVGEDIIKIQQIAKKHNIFFFEDSCQSLGQRFQNQHAGTFGVFGVCSFSGTKLVRTGEGGAIFTDSLALHEKIEEARDMGIFNFTMSDLCARLLYSQLKSIDEIIERRIEIHNKYTNNGLKLLEPGNADRFIGYNTAAYLSKKAVKISKMLSGQNIPNRYAFYPSFTHQCNADKAYKSYIELPFDFHLTDKDVERIIKIIEISER